MQIAHNPQTGEYLGLQDGQWQPLQMAENDAGERLFLDDDGWKPLPGWNTDRPQEAAGEAPRPAMSYAQATPKEEAPQPPSKPTRTYDLQLENPIEGEDYEAPTETERKAVDKAADAMRSVMPSPETMRGFGLGTRSVLQGLGGAFDIVRNPLNQLNAALGGAPDYIPNLGTLTADAMDLPKPQGGAEGVLHGGVEMAATAVPYLLSGQALSGAASPVISSIGNFLKLAPAEQIAGSAAAGAASEAVRQNGGSGAAQLLAGMAAGMTPGLGASVLRTGSRAAGTVARAADMFTEGGRDRAAGRTLARAAGGSPDDLIRTAENAAEIVPGSKPTLGQLQPGENLATLEKGIASSGQGQRIQERYMEQAAARQAAVDDAVSSASGRLAAERAAAAESLPAGMDADMAGPVIRDTYNRNYNAARQKTRRAYEAIDPDGTATFNLQPLYEANNGLLGGSRYAEIPAAVRSIQGRIADDIQNGIPATYADMQAMRTTLTDLAEGAARTGDKATERIATGMKRNLDDYLDTAATQRGFTPEQAQRFEAARQQRIEQGQNFETGVNEAMSRRGGSLTGQAVSDPAIAGRYFSKGAAGAENMRAFKRMARGDRKAENALKEYARGLLHASAFGKDGVLSASKIAKFRKDYAAALKELPEFEKEIAQLEKFVRRQEQQLSGLRAVARQNGDGWRMQRNVDLQGAAGGRFGPQGAGTFTPDELNSLAAVQRDQARATRAAQVAQVKGSPTAQILATQDLARRFWGEKPSASSSSWLGSAIGNIMQGAANKLLFSGTNDAITQRLASAMLDPSYAAYLVRRAGQETSKQRENLLDLLARSAGGAANVTARTATKDN